MAGFPSVTAAGDAVGAVIAAGIIPAGLEMMDRLAIQAAEDFAGAGYPRDAEALLLCEVDGTREEVASCSRECGGPVPEDGGEFRDRVPATRPTGPCCGRGASQHSPRWAGWRRTTTAWTAPFPAARFRGCSTRYRALSEHYGLAVANVFHAGDGNLHPLILFDASKAQEVRRAEQFGAASSSCPCRWAVVSPGNTAWGWRNCAR